jgi:hypothetical protein
MVYSADPAAYPRRSPIGVWDRTILCETCERLFQRCDDHAQLVLRARPYDSGVDYFTLHSFDYILLKRFFMGVLWRASVSSQEMFSRVDVGAKHECRLRELIRADDLVDPEEYAVWLTMFDELEPAGVVLQPTRLKIKGVNAYRFVIASFTIFIKVDQRPTPYPANTALLRPGAEIPVIVRSWRTSAERRDVLRVAATARE